MRCPHLHTWCGSGARQAPKHVPRMSQWQWGPVSVGGCTWTLCCRTSQHHSSARCRHSRPRSTKPLVWPTLFLATRRRPRPSARSRAGRLQTLRRSRSRLRRPRPVLRSHQSCATPLTPAVPKHACYPVTCTSAHVCAGWLASVANAAYVYMHVCHALHINQEQWFCIPSVLQVEGVGC